VIAPASAAASNTITISDAVGREMVRGLAEITSSGCCGCTAIADALDKRIAGSRKAADDGPDHDEDGTAGSLARRLVAR
jgi:hypothetical protein